MELKQHLNENTFWSTEHEKDKFLSSNKKIFNNFWINYLGVLALANTYPEDVKLKTYLRSSPVRINNVADDDSDLMIVMREMSNKQLITDNVMNQLTRLLAKIKKGEIDSIDENVLRDLFTKIQIAKVQPYEDIRKPIVKWKKGEYNLSDLITPFYQQAKKRKIAKEWIGLVKRIQTGSEGQQDVSIEEPEDDNKSKLSKALNPTSIQQTTDNTDIETTFESAINNITTDDLSGIYRNNYLRAITSYLTTLNKNDIKKKLDQLGIKKGEIGGTVLSDVFNYKTDTLKQMLTNKNNYGLEKFIVGYADTVPTDFIYNNFLVFFKAFISKPQTQYLAKNFDFNDDQLLVDVLELRASGNRRFNTDMESYPDNLIDKFFDQIIINFNKDPVYTINRWNEFVTLKITKSAINTTSAPRDVLMLNTISRYKLKSDVTDVILPRENAEKILLNSYDKTNLEMKLYYNALDKLSPGNVLDWCKYWIQNTTDYLYDFANYCLSNEQKIKIFGFTKDTLLDFLYTVSTSEDITAYITQRNGWQTWLDIKYSDINWDRIKRQNNLMKFLFQSKFKSSSDEEKMVFLEHVDIYYLRQKITFEQQEWDEIFELIMQDPDTTLKNVSVYDWWHIIKGTTDSENNLINFIRKWYLTIGYNKFDPMVRLSNNKVFKQVFDVLVMDQNFSLNILHSRISSSYDTFPVKQEQQQDVREHLFDSIHASEPRRWPYHISRWYKDADEDTIYFIDNIYKPELFNRLDQTATEDTKYENFFKLYERLFLNDLMDKTELWNMFPDLDKNMIYDDMYLQSHTEQVIDFLGEDFVYDKISFKGEDMGSYVFSNVFQKLYKHNKQKTLDKIITSDGFKTNFKRLKLRSKRKSFKLTAEEFDLNNIVLDILQSSDISNDKVDDIFDMFEEKDQKHLFNNLKKTYSIVPLLKDMKGEKAPFKPTVEISEQRIQQLLKFNNFEYKGMPRKKKNESYTKYFERIQSDNSSAPVVEELQIDKIKETSEQLEEKTTEYSKYMNFKHGNVGVEFLETFNVSLPTDKYENFKNLTNNFLVPCFHGTGNVAANFILRFGFTVLSSSDESVVGRMLNEDRIIFRMLKEDVDKLDNWSRVSSYTYTELIDMGWEPVKRKTYDDPDYTYTTAYSVDGVYITNVTEKAAQYLGDAGFTRGQGTVGVLLEMEANIGEEGLHHSAAGITGDDIVSPEWCVFHPKAQLKITKAHKVKIVPKGRIKQLRKQHPNMLNEVKYFPHLESFKKYLQEKQMIADDSIANYVFCDNQAPDDKENVYTWKTFKRKFENDNIKIYSHQRGFVVSIKNTKNINGTFMVPGVDEFIVDDPQGLHSQYEIIFKEAK